MSLDERLRAARPAVLEVPVDLEGRLQDAMRGGVRRRRAWRATAIASLALLLALVSIPVVRNVSRRNADVADRIQREERNEREVREDSSKGSAPRSSSTPQRHHQSSNGDAPAAGPRTEVNTSTGRVAFVAAGSDEIYVMDLDGSRKTSLGSGVDPDWSPDGERIAYASGDTGVCSTPDAIGATTVEKPDPCEVWVMGADGSNKRRLAAGGSPAWSPDGRRIAYFGGPTGDTEIFVMNADGSGNVRLTDSPGSSHSPSWSPDGTRIAFVRRESCGSGCLDNGLYVMDADGSGQQQLAVLPGALDPAWAPDGVRIAVGGRAEDNYELFDVRSDGTELTRLTHDDGTGDVLDNFDGQPAWVGDGQIVFSRDPDGPTGWSECYTWGAEPRCGAGGPAPASIVLMSADGSGRVLLGEGRMPAVAPR